MEEIIKEMPTKFKDNCFDVIRIACAISIMFSHYCVNTFGQENVFREFLFAGSSLCVFFVLQGYLVIPSSLRNNAKEYTKKRLLRLYPSFILTLLGTIIIVSFIGTNPGIIETFIYLTKELFLFKGSDFQGISNGAIWAVFIQIQVYIVSFFIARRLISINSAQIWFLILILLLCINYLDKQILLLLDEIGLHYVGAAYTHLFIRYAYFFWLGMMIYKFYDKCVPYLKRYAYLLLIIHIIWHIGLINLPVGYCYTDPITVVTASFAAIGIAYKIGRIKLKYDISYDVFVWHMPIYTALCLFLNTKGWTFIALAIILTLLLSFLSNHITRQIVKYFN